MLAIRNRMKADLTQAMKQRQKAAVTVLRSVLGTIDNAEAVEVDTAYVPMQGQTKDVARKVLTEEDVRVILMNEMAERRAVIAEYEQVGQAAAAEEMRAEVEVIKRYVH